MLGFGLERETAEAIRTLDEHWDGGGQPRGLRGEQIPVGGRIVCLAQTAEIFHRAGGVRAACRVAERRRGHWFDPALVDALNAVGRDAGFWAGLAEPDLAGVEPPDRVLVADDQRLDGIADAFAGIIDAKSPWTHRHSDGVRLIASRIASRMEFEPTGVRDLARAATLHDVGKLGVSNRILDSPRPLTCEEFARVKEHAVLTQQILERVPGFSELAPLASTHHERLDGSGYPDGLTGAELTMPMRVLAVADVYEALTSARPYRPAWSSEKALAIMRADVPRRLDGDAFGELEALVADDASLGRPVAR